MIKGKSDEPLSYLVVILKDLDNEISNIDTKTVEKLIKYIKKHEIDYFKDLSDPKNIRGIYISKNYYYISIEAGNVFIEISNLYDRDENDKYVSNVVEVENFKKDIEIIKKNNEFVKFISFMKSIPEILSIEMNSMEPTEYTWIIYKPRIKKESPTKLMVERKKFMDKVINLENVIKEVEKRRPGYLKEYEQLKVAEQLYN